MARFSVNEADNYGGQGGGGFFSLKKDKEVAQVRFLYNGIDDVHGDSVHEITLDGKKRYVNCLRVYGDPVDVCPLCATGNFSQVKYFVPIYNLKTNTTQTWERGKKFGSKLTSMCSRYPNTVTHIFEIERNGAPQDQQTTYEIYETGVTPDVTLDQFEFEDPLGTIILDKTAEEMQVFITTGNFPNNEANNAQQGGAQQGGYPQRRESVQPANGGNTFVRRTPATGPATGGERVPF